MDRSQVRRVEPWIGDLELALALIVYVGAVRRAGVACRGKEPHLVACARAEESQLSLLTSQ